MRTRIRGKYCFAIVLGAVKRGKPPRKEKDFGNRLGLACFIFNI